MKTHSSSGWFYQALRRLAAQMLSIASALPLVAGPVHDAVFAGDMEKARTLIAGAPALVLSTNSGGEMPLHVAAAVGRPDLVELLLAAKAPVDGRDAGGSTPLFHAAAGTPFHGTNNPAMQASTSSLANLLQSLNNTASATFQEENRGLLEQLRAQQQRLMAGPPEELAARLTCMDLLLASGADVRATNRWGSTPLHHAATWPSDLPARRLLRAGAKPDAVGGFQGAAPLHAAVVMSSSNVITALVEAGASLELRDVDGMTPLFYAVTRTNHAIMRRLLSLGADANAVRDDGGSALILAAGLDSVEAVELLLQHGADHRAKGGVLRASALHLAAWGTSPETVAVLLKGGADVDSRDKISATPLFNAAEKGRLEIARILLDHKANANAVSMDPSQHVPLHVAASGGHVEVVRLLLDRGARLRATTRNNSTAMHEAASGGRVAVVRLLLERGLSATDVAGGQFSTPLNWVFMGPFLGKRALAASKTNGIPMNPMATDEDYRKVAELLLEHGAGVNDRDELKQTPIFTAAGTANETGVAWLLERKAEVNLRDNLQRTPLALAAIGGSPAIIRMLVKAGANITARVDGNRTLMHSAAGSGQAEAVKTLGELGLGTEAKDENGATPLHWAAMATDPSALRLLVKMGADVNAVDRYEVTPLRMAVMQDRPASVEALLEARADTRIRDRVDALTPFQAAKQLRRDTVLAAFRKFNVTE